MDRVTLYCCASALGLSACVSAPARVAAEAGAPAPDHGAEPSGLGMARSPRAGESEGAGFHSEDHQWCGVVIDARARPLELSSSVLQAWNLFIEHGGYAARYGGSVPTTEADARARVCGHSSCELDQPLVVQARQLNREGLGVLIPLEDRLLPVPVGVVGAHSECTIAPTLESERDGQLLHLSVTARRGEYARIYFHGQLDEYYGDHYGAAYGECEAGEITRSDLIIDLDAGTVELRLTQLAPRDGDESLVPVELADRRVALHGCGEVLELAWTEAPALD